MSDESDRKRKEIQEKSVMLYVGGSKTAFRCECGCNVMHKETDDKGLYYICNGCSNEYRGEK